MLVQRESTIRDRWDYMRANALSSNPTVAERQLFTAFDRWVKTGGVTEGSFRPQVQDTDTNLLHRGLPVRCQRQSGTCQAISQSHEQGSAGRQSGFVCVDCQGRQRTAIDAGPEPEWFDSDGFRSIVNPVGASRPGPGSKRPTPPPIRNWILSASSRAIIYLTKVACSGMLVRVRPVARVETITFCGAAMFDGQGSAWFDGSGVRDSRAYKVGDVLIGDLKIAKINISTP